MQIGRRARHLKGIPTGYQWEAHTAMHIHYKAEARSLEGHKSLVAFTQ